MYYMNIVSCDNRTGECRETNAPTDPLMQIGEFYDAIKNRRSMSRQMYHKYHHVAPYVFKYTRTGRIVLFNRRYQPLVELVGKKWVNVPLEWIDDIFAGDFVYNDGCQPWQSLDTFERVKTILAFVISDKGVD